MTDSTQKSKLMVENISCILPKQSNLGGLFLGNVYGAQNPVIMKQYGIRAVLTCSIQTDINYGFQDIPFHMKIEAHDKENYNLKEHLNKCIDFIQKARELTNVYVHCFAGVSRSAAIVCAYIMWKLKWNYDTTIAFLKAKRIVAKPNQGFVRQLLSIEDTILGQGSYSSSSAQKIDKLPSNISPQAHTNSIAPKQPLQYQNTSKIEQTFKNQNPVPQRASSSISGSAYVDKSLQINSQNYQKIGHLKLLTNPHQNGMYMTDRYQNTSHLTSPVNHQSYPSLQSELQKAEKTDRFLYLQNFFPPNHTHKTHVADPKSTQNNMKFIQQNKKSKNNSTMKTTGENWTTNQIDQLLSTTSTQFYRSVQNPNNSSAKNLMNHQAQKGLSSTSQLVLGGIKKPSYTQNNSPGPKVLEKRNHQKSNHQLTRVSEMILKTNNRTIAQIHQHRFSQGIEIMPKVNEYAWTGSGQQKFSIRNMASEELMKSPANNFSNKKFDFRNFAQTDGFSNSKSVSQQKQSQKINSRLLVRPKDLPGYKNY